MKSIPIRLKMNVPYQFLCIPKCTDELKTSIESYEKNIKKDLIKYSRDFSDSELGRRILNLSTNIANEIAEGTIFLKEDDEVDLLLREYQDIFFEVDESSNKSEDDERCNNLRSILGTSELRNIPLTCESVKIWKKRTDAWNNHYLPLLN